MTDCLALRHAAHLHRALIAWFHASARDLPWRRRRTLYGTWVSEMMLQQTTVAAVVPYWERFLARFPDVDALAAADEAEVLALWSGLGYYRRARMLHAAARRIVGELGGMLPDSRDRWAELPGVGPYAAGAIASIGLGQAVPAVDANARRILTRLCCGDPEQAAAFTDRQAAAVGEKLVPAGQAAAWNEGLMELGATLCRAAAADCGACPLAAWCAAAASGQADRIAPRAQRTAPTAVVASVAVVRSDRGLWLRPPGTPTLAVPGVGPAARDDLRSLHRGLWGLPGTAWYPAERDGDGWSASLVRAWSAWGGETVAEPVRVVARIRHAITRFRLAIDVVALRVRPGADGAGEGAWSPWPADLPVSRLAAKAVTAESRASG